MSSARLPPVVYTLICSDGPATDDWRAHRFRMREAINEPYQIFLDVETEDVDADIEDLLGASVEVELRRGDFVQVVLGVVAGVDWLGISADGRVQLRLDIRPAFALLDQRVNSRLWQDATALDIIAEVLDEALPEYSRSYDVDSTSRGQSVRSYCVQYCESDFAFVCRLLEEEGINYHFVHDLDGGHEVLTLFDEPGQLETILNCDGGSVFPLVTSQPDEIDVESVQAIEWRRRLGSTAVLRRDFDWLMPRDLLDSDAEGTDGRGRARRIYTHGRRRFESDDLAQRASDLRAVETLAAMRGWGRGNSTSFRGGRLLALDNHELAVLGEDLVVLRVEHEGEDRWDSSSGESSGGYRNMFECVPASTELRPTQRTPKPRVHGPQTAIVCGAEGAEIDVDEHGRIRVQFHWQEQPSYDPSSSCWVRVAQSWAGPSWGSQFIPRVGMEVVVEFLEGNPDRPLVTGCVYNGDNPPPFALPDDKTQSGIRTSSSPGGGGSNELRFEDAAGAEEIYLHGQKDWTIAIDNDKSQTVGNNESLSVGNDRSKSVGHDETIDVGNDQTITIGNDEGESVGNNLTLSVGNDQTITVGNNQTVTIASNRSETVGSSLTQTVGVSKVVTVGAAMQLSVGAAYNQTVGAASAEEVGGLKSVSVGLNHQEEVSGTRSIEAGKDIVVKAGAKGTLETGDALGIICADKLSMNAEKDMMVGTNAKGMFEAKDKLTLKCGKAQIVLAKNGEVTITGGKITVKGSKDVIVKGSKVKSN